jgi:hypothetical protein
MAKAKAKKIMKDFDDEEKKEEKPKGRTQPIVIKPLQLKEGNITIVGMSPLLVNKFDNKIRQELDDSYQEGLNAKERKIKREDKTRERKTPQAEFEASLYPFPGKPGYYGIPAAGIKKCAITAASLSNVPMTVAMKAFHIVGDTSGLVEILGSSPISSSKKSKKATKPEPVMDERIVRVGPFGNKKPATRRRARFDNWEITFRVKYRADLITVEQLINLYESAGFSVGLCEYRPEKSGNLGMFTVKRGVIM